MPDWLDWFLHLDDKLTDLTDTYGLWTYAILFAIVFAETGLVVTPFLPGDSLLFMAGGIAAQPRPEPPILGREARIGAQCLVHLPAFVHCRGLGRHG